MKEQQSCYFMTSKLLSVLENSSIFIIKVSQAEFMSGTICFIL